MWIDGRSIDDIGASCLFMSGRGKTGKRDDGALGKREKDGRWKER